MGEEPGKSLFFKISLKKILLCFQKHFIWNRTYILIKIPKIYFSFFEKNELAHGVPAAEKRCKFPLISTISLLTIQPGVL